MTPPARFRTGGAFEWDWSDLRLRCLNETRRVLGPGGAAEDATQEALIRAWRQRDSCQDPRRPGPWISTIARREALRLASRHVHDRSLDFACRGGPPAVDANDGEAGGALVAAVEALDPEDRWLVFAHYWQDRSFRELGRELGCPEATVRVRLFRVRRRLRQALCG
ncbi:MAG TPA: RNA polymerase sigma factor [Solirubrobacteraceae bacterium]|nr:RNA polymerase sigma factor [Solirubrobacteraceae bacterium]